MSDYVYGLNKSGISVIKHLIQQKKTFDCWDDNKKIRNSIKKNYAKLEFKKIDKNLKKYKNIYLTPGISIQDKRFVNVSRSKIKRDLNIIFTKNKYPTLYLDGELFAHKLHLPTIAGLAKKPKTRRKKFINTNFSIFYTS